MHPITPIHSWLAGLRRGLLTLLAIAVIWPLTPAIAAAASAESEPATPTYAEAIILGTTPDSLLQGDVRLIPRGDGLEIQAGIIGLPPGQHGFHLHENGSCAEAGNAAGGHFNPDQVKHGKLLSDGFSQAHAGDLGNIQSTAIGVGALDLTIPGLSLTEGSHAIANRAIVIHADADDFGQPTGNAGGRIGCGVIELVTE